MSKVKAARQEWEEQYAAALLKFEPRLALDDALEEAWQRYESSGHENPIAVARRAAHVDDERTEEMILGVNTPAWMTPGAEVPPGWRFDGGRWRND
jgi:phage baseplate assembly protein W